MVGFPQWFFCRIFYRQNLFLSTHNIVGLKFIVEIIDASSQVNYKALRNLSLGIRLLSSFRQIFTQLTTLN